MKTIILSILIMLSGNIILGQNKSIYDYTAKTITGDDFDFSSLKGKKILIVNTASKCGYTPQYEDLQELHEKYGSDNFVIIGFPANDFMKQEPGSDKEIEEFCKLNYGVSFQMMSKIHVKGDQMHPVYKWLTDKKLNGYENSKVKWNFQKYFINEKGELVAVFPSSTKPLDSKIIELITNK